MKLNADTAISAPKVLLVPYDRRHVPRYHEWMSDPAIQEATASEPLTLEEEYENQESWRASTDKLTFILCQPLAATGASSVAAGSCDAPERMVGDINFFLYPWDDDGGDDEDGGDGDATTTTTTTAAATEGWCVGEIDVMIASPGDRGKGLGRAAVSTFLHYIWSNRDAILREYHGHQAASSTPELKSLMAKIKAENVASIALFRRLGFEQVGDVNYFGEIKMVLRDLEGIARRSEEFEVLTYVRSTEP